jgi:hypothetical protein
LCSALGVRGGPRVHDTTKRVEEKKEKGREDEGARGKKIFSLFSLSLKARNEYFIGRDVQEQI